MKSSQWFLRLLDLKVEESEDEYHFFGSSWAIVNPIGKLQNEFFNAECPFASWDLTIETSI